MCIFDTFYWSAKWYEYYYRSMWLVWYLVIFSMVTRRWNEMEWCTTNNIWMLYIQSYSSRGIVLSRCILIDPVMGLFPQRQRQMFWGWICRHGQDWKVAIRCRTSAQRFELNYLLKTWGIAYKMTITCFYDLLGYFHSDLQVTSLR